MDCNAAGIRRYIETAVEEAKSAEFVAMDLELTGLLEEKDCRPSFAFLHHAGFDFNRWIAEGQNFERLTAIQYAEESTFKSLISKEVLQHGLQRLIETIIEHDVPIVLHNGMLDMLHIYDKFVGAIPSVQEPDDPESPDSAIGKFCQDWLRLFRGGVFDTKYIATSCQYSVLGLADGRSTALEPLRAHLIKLRLRSQFEIASHLSHSGYLLQTIDDEVNSFSHEAGFDAMATAQVFVMELELLSTRKKTSIKSFPGQQEGIAMTEKSFFEMYNRKTLLYAINNVMDIVHRAHDWKNNQIYEKFKNVIGLYNVSPDNLRLERYLSKNAITVMDEIQPSKRQKTANVSFQTIV